ncbi:hypothetical protein [Providencia stuartii]|uniref:hypothetical protein n=1 Tax=Providencia stuartii TaxID=588 RepID=UPI0030025AB2
MEIRDSDSNKPIADSFSPLRMASPVVGERRLNSTAMPTVVAVTTVVVVPTNK